MQNYDYADIQAATHLLRAIAYLPFMLIFIFMVIRAMLWFSKERSTFKNRATRFDKIIRPDFKRAERNRRKKRA